MLTGLTAEERDRFLERTSATAIANQAILKCLLSGFPLTTDNAILFVGDFADPGNPQFESLFERINEAIESVVDVKSRTDRFADDFHR
ncbi:MAG: hypothetical protein PW791_05930 [Neorhizobium sp.]|nr:hypothetical protein [Neorhizobium sp.]